jgi:hypothetical protein
VGGKREKIFPQREPPQLHDRLNMNVDVYARPEAGNKLSYLIVPAGEPVPHEAENIDWQLRKSGVHIDETAELVHPYEIHHARDQMNEKGYAITSLADQVPADQAGA